MKTIWIAWEEHRRTKELAGHFNIDTFIFTSKHPRLLKHSLFLIKTMCILIKLKPDIVIVQNPSIVLALFCCLVKSFFKFKLVVDLHNAAILAENNLLKYFYFIYRYVHKKSDLNIVTNNNLKDVIAEDSCQTIILPDRLPTFSLDYFKPKIVVNISNYFVAICTFGIDEPYGEIIEAGRLNSSITIIITGNHHKCPIDLKNNLPRNVLLSGYLPEDEYVGLLYYSKGVIDLTIRDNCLVCGAYEAVSLGKPMILSDTRSLREYFPGGGVFCRNDRFSICDAIITINNDNELYLNKVNELKKQILFGWRYHETVFNKSMARLALLK